MLSFAVAIVAVALAFWTFRRAARLKKPLPPGPPRLPLIGNALQLKPSHSWLYYAEVAKQYGDVVSYEVFGQPIITLNSMEAIDDLIVKKSALFCGRPHLPMCTEIAGWEQGFALLPANAQWQVSRKLAHQFIGPQAMPRYQAFLEAEARGFVNGLSASPGRFRERFKFTMARVVLELTYGITAKNDDDEYIRLAEEATIIFGLATQPGKFLVDTFPILKYVPAWMPGAGFKQLGAQWREKVLLNVNKPFDKVKTDMAAGVHKSSFVADSLETPIAGSNDDVIKWMSASLYGGSADTTTGTIAGFLLNMVLHPDVQAKAQAEIDAVTGGERLPSFSDRRDLPYVDAILKETLRFHPIAPMSIPYTASEDYHYRGWIIPKGSLLMASVWSVQRDPKRYSSPDQFIPERFIDNPNLLDPHQTFFGFGRRVCPGQYIADSMLWITIATVLATCKISKAVNALGDEVTPAPEYTGGTICEPVEFPYAIELRSSNARSLLQDVSADRHIL